MLKSYAAIYRQGHLEWLDDTPEQDNIQVIVTFISSTPKKQSIQAYKILQQAWGCVETSHTIQQIDNDILQMRSE
jgi:hypothetical protein